jgi:hypothetical protein
VLDQSNKPSGSGADSSHTFRKAGQSPPASVLSRQVISGISIVAGLLAYGLFIKRGIWLSVVGYSVSPSERVLRGEVPFTDFLYNYTPGLLWVNAGLMKVFGAKLLTIRIGIIAFKLGTLAVLSKLGLRLGLGWAGLAPVFLTLAWLDHKYLLAPYPTQYSMAFVLLAALLVLRYEEGGRLRSVFAAGAAVGTVLVFKYNVGILVAVSGSAALAIKGFVDCESASWRAHIARSARLIGCFLLGFFGVAVAMAVVLALQGGLWPMLDHFSHHIAEYDEMGAVPMPPLRHLLPAAAASVVGVAGAILVHKGRPALLSVYVAGFVVVAAAPLMIPGRAHIIKTSAAAAVAYLPLATFLVVLVWALWLFWRSRKSVEARRGWWRRCNPVIIVGFFALGAYLEIYPRADIYHLVRVLPPVFVLLTWMLSRGAEWLTVSLSGRIRRPVATAALCATGPLILVGLVGVGNTWGPHFDSRGRFIDRMPLSIERAAGFRVGRREAEMIETLERLIDENSSPQDSIFSFARRGSAFYFLSNRRNPSRLTWWRSVGLKEEDRKRVLQMIANRELRLILLQNGLTDGRVRDAMTANYHQVGNALDISVYRAND